MFEIIKYDDIHENLGKKIHYEWPLLVVDDKEHNKVNAMTVNWVQTGYLWRRNVVTVYVREARYTYNLINSEDTFALCFLNGEHKTNLAYLGSASGKDEDKLAKCHYHTAKHLDTAYIEESDLVLICKKLYVDHLKHDNFLFDESEVYNNDYHEFIIAEVVDVLKKSV